jgi:hypothetical protein
MDELSYSDALDRGIEPVLYRASLMAELGPGTYPARLDALVWAKHHPALQALLTLEDGAKLLIMAFKKNSRQDFGPYLGLRGFTPGQRVNVVIEIGPRGGIKGRLIAIP